MAIEGELLAFAKLGRRRHKKNTNSFSEVSCFTDEEDREREHNDNDGEESPEQNMDSDLDLSDREEVKIQ
jgi:hypothetical protein